MLLLIRGMLTRVMKRHCYLMNDNKIVLTRSESYQTLKFDGNQGNKKKTRPSVIFKFQSK